MTVKHRNSILAQAECGVYKLYSYSMRRTWSNVPILNPMDLGNVVQPCAWEREERAKRLLRI